MRNENKNEKFLCIIRELLQKKQYKRFDAFIICRMGYALEGTKEEKELIRRKAYHTFLTRVSEERPASLPTIRRWFGICDFKEPLREQVFRIAFAAGLSVEETKQYLMEGIREPSFQINDYTEIIAMYGLENHWSYTKYNDMVREYETGLERQQKISREANTQWLFREFEHVKQHSEEQFMYWMWKHAGVFKGYSKTAQEYLNKYREMVLEYMRQDAKKRLDLLLAETGYDAWKRRRFHNISGNEWGSIQKYIRWNKSTRKKEVSDLLAENIMELARIVFSKNGKNTRLLSELFTVSKKRDGSMEELPVDVVKAASGKYLSDLFHIPEQNEKWIRVRQAIRELENCRNGGKCPEYIREQICEYSKNKIQVESAEEALEWLEEYEREGRRRRHIVKRSDLLPMVLYVSQQKYLGHNAESGEHYQCEKAKKLFIDLANATMIACNMPEVDSTYLFDQILLACFQEDEVYGYGDVLELLA